jgi:ATP synthase F1 gamma subunit
MSGYRKLHKKLKSSSKFQQLTKSIQMVALSKLRFVQKKVTVRRIALTYIKRLFDDFNSKYSTLLLIPISSDRSCCGPINDIIANHARNIVFEAKNRKRSAKVLLIGKKAKFILRKQCLNELVKNIYNLNREPLSLLVSTILLEKISKYDYDKCIILFHRFHTVMNQKPTQYTILSYNYFLSNFFKIIASLDFDKSSSIINQFFFSILLEKGSLDDYFLNDLYQFSFGLSLLDALEENELSELGARACAMENASRNAKKIISSLELQYHKARQAAITNELIEIVSCIDTTA